jgi:tight adherence protein B
MWPGLIYGCAFAGMLLAASAGSRKLQEAWKRFSQAYTQEASLRLDAAWLRLPPERLLQWSFACAAGGGLLGWTAIHPLAGLFLGAGAFFLPSLVLQRLIQKRRTRFAQQLPAALEQWVNTLKSGGTLQRAMEEIARSGPAPMAEEFGLMLREMLLGRPLVEALERTHERTREPNLKLAIQAIQVAEETGGPLTDTLAHLVETVRERRRVSERLKTLTAQGKMQGWVIGLLPVALGGVLYLMEPSSTRAFFTSRPGATALAAMAVLELAALLWIRRILQIPI